MSDVFDRFQRGELVVVAVDVDERGYGTVTVGPRTPEVAYLMAAEERLFAELAACPNADVWKPMDLPILVPEPEEP